MKFLPALAALTALALSSCGKKPAPSAAPSTPTPPPPPSEDPRAIRLGFLAPLTGAQATFGQEALHGARLAVDEINTAGGVLERPLVLTTRDTASLADRTSPGVIQLIETEDVAAVIGEIATDRTLLAAPEAQARGIPLITPGSTNEQVTAVGDQIFRVCFTDLFQAEVMARFARSIQVERAAVLFDPSSPYSAGLAKIFKERFTGAGGTLVAEETYQAGDDGFTRQLDAIRAKNPEVVFLPSYYPEAARIIREARQLGLDAPFLGTDGWDSPEFLAVGGSAVDNCYFSGHFSAENQSPRVQAFVTAYTRQFGSAPPPLAALSYDAVYLVADALRRAGSTAATPLREALAATRDFDGVTGHITLDADRNPAKSAVITRVESGTFTYLETIDP